MSGPIQNGFQGSVNNQPGVAESGDFYGTNPRAVVLAGPGAFVSPASELTVGNFAWADTDTGVVSQSEVAGFQVAFVGRAPNQAVITAFLAPSTYLINPGFPVTLHSQGDFWTTFAGGATPGQSVYADPATGAAIAGAAGGISAASGTGSVGAALTAAIGAAFTGAVTSNVLTVSALTGFLTPGDLVHSASITNGVLGAQLTGTPGAAGTYTLTHADVASEAMTTTSNTLVASAVTGFVSVGDTVTGAGFTTATITAQLTGSTGGVGHYTVSGSGQQVASEAMVDSSNVLDLTAVATGAFGPGDVLTGPSGSPTIVSQNSGTPGGVGFYTISGAPIHYAPGSITVGGVATGFFVNSVAAAGELAKISSWG